MVLVLLLTACGQDEDGTQDQVKKQPLKLVIFQSLMLFHYM